MSQAVVTVNQLIINALYLTGELGVGEPVDNFMLSSGLDFVNELLDKFSSDSIYVPYLTTETFTFVVGQATYSFSNIIINPDVDTNRIVDLSFANYVVPTTGSTNLVYPLRIISKEEYYNVIRQNNLLTRPAFVFLNRQPQESDITFYPAPDQPYICTLQVKEMLNSLGPTDTLGELPPNYYGFMKYALARKFISIYPSANWPQTNEDEYQDYYQLFKNVNETDLTVRPSVIFTSPEPFYWPNIVSY